MTESAFLDMSALRAALGHRRAMRVYLYDTLDSTNSEAKRRAGAETAPTLTIARTQTAGRGRLGRQFHSPADTGLYMTVSYTTARPLNEAVTVTAGAAVAAVTVLEALTDRPIGIKWVNDLYMDGGKLAGILAEAVTLSSVAGQPRTRLVVGWGINLTTTAFPADLRAPATCLFPPAEAARATPTFVGTLAGEIACRLLDLVENRPAPDGSLPGGLGGAACLEAYRRHALYIGERVTCTRGSECFEGVVEGIDADYSLRLTVNGETVSLSSGEVSVRPTEK